MKFKLVLSSVSVLGLLTTGLHAAVIYGVDDRTDIFESSDALMKELSLSTAAMIPNDNIFYHNGLYTIKSETLTDRGICKNERFSNQLIASKCSGFLVSPDTIVTAGHCINSVEDCENVLWVFDYANITEEKSAFTFKPNQVFHCTKLIARKKDEKTLNDYSVMKLDRAVLDRQPLKYRTSGKVSDDASITVIGYPSGLPAKIASGAVVRNNKNPIYFVTNADTFNLNSGSAVIDSKTGLVEGILVRGDTDYMHSIEGNSNSCLMTVHRDSTGGRGEDVTRITNIKALK
jgi:V8-like Glu-specific endopeptidase